MRPAGNGEAVSYPTAPPPGWYTDPAGGLRVRWWDGRAWTDHTWSRPPGIGGGAPDEVIAGEQRINVWAQRAGAVYFLVAMADLLGYYPESVRFRRVFHWYRQFAHNIGTPGYVAPHQPQLISPWVSLLGLVTIPCVVVLLVWQYRADSAARALGRPAVRSPGWGVGSWFVPVVNLWMPFQALRDCLPPGHPQRRAPWRLLAGLVIESVVSTSAIFALVYARPLGDVLVVLGMVVCGALIAVLVPFIRSVGDANVQGPAR